eukprot:351955-Chlamydomonas_euryale.AAC.23
MSGAQTAPACLERCHFRRSLMPGPAGPGVAKCAAPIGDPSSGVTGLPGTNSRFNSGVCLSDGRAGVIGGVASCMYACPVLAGVPLAVRATAPAGGGAGALRTTCTAPCAPAASAALAINAVTSAVLMPSALAAAWCSACSLRCSAATTASLITPPDTCCCCCCC